MWQEDNDVQQIWSQNHGNWSQPEHYNGGYSVSGGMQYGKRFIIQNILNTYRNIELKYYLCTTYKIYAVVCHTLMRSVQMSRAFEWER